MGSVREIKKYTSPSIDNRLVEVLKDLREYVDNIGFGKTQFVNGVYRPQNILDVQTTKYGEWEFGYQIKPTIDPGLFERNIYIKLKGEEIMDVPEKDREKIMTAVYKAMIDVGNEFPRFELIANDCIKVTQKFAIVYWKEFNPNIVTPGRKG